MAEMLLKVKAKINVMTDDNKAPLDISMEKDERTLEAGRKPTRVTARFLRKHGARTGAELKEEKR